MPIRKLGTAQEIPFFDYAPDLASTTPGIILDANAAIPTVKGYKARNNAVVYAPALPTRPLGAYIALYSDGSTSVIAGTLNSLYRLVGGAWNLIGTGYTATFPWVFAQFADDVLATSAGNTRIQVAPGPSGTFNTLDGTAPTNATSVISVAGFAAAYNRNEWFNSSAGVDTSWTPNVQTQSGSGFLYDLPGNIVAAAPFFRNQILWKTTSMYQLTYIGGTQVWGNQILSPGTGTWGQGCVCLTPSSIAFLGTDDFYVCQGYAPSRIPNNFKENFFENVAQDAAGNPTQLQNTTSWFDPINGVVYWHYVSTVAPFPGVPDQYVGWNTRSGRWTHGYLNTPLVVGNTQPSLENGLYFDNNNQLMAWTGPPATMSILTGYQGDADNLTQIQKIRVAYTQHYIPTTQICLPMHSNRLGDPPVVEGSAVLATDGWFNTRVTDRYHQMRLTTTGNAEMMAIAYEARVAGVR